MSLVSSSITHRIRIQLLAGTQISGIIKKNIMCEFDFNKKKENNGRISTQGWDVGSGFVQLTPNI